MSKDTTVLSDLKETTEAILKCLSKQTVVFPEVQSGAFRLGSFYEATIQVGDDAPQPKRLVFAMMLTKIPVEVFEKSSRIHEQELLTNALSCLMSKRQKGVMMATPHDQKLIANPVLHVLYPTPLNDFQMTPLPNFDFWGNETVKVFDAVECRKAHSLFKKTAAYGSNTVIIAGTYAGRTFDGLERLM